MLKRVGERRHPCRTHCCSEPVSYAAVEEDDTSGLVIEVFDDLDKVCANVVLLHGCSQSCMPNPVEDLIEVLKLRLKICSVVLISALKPAFSSAMISACGFNLCNMIFSMTLLG